MVTRTSLIPAILLFFITVSFSFAQTSKIDSLKSSLNNEASAIDKIKINYSLAKLFESSIPDSALSYYEAGLKLSEEIKNDTLIAKGCNSVGYLFYLRGKYNEAISYLFRALNIFESHHLNKNTITCLQYIGIAYNEQGMFDKAMNYSTQALKIAQATDDKYQAAVGMTILGSIYYSQLNYDKSLEYFQQALHNMEAIGSKQGISDALNNVALIYENKKDYPKALEYHLRSLQMAKELKDIKGTAASYHNIGLVYKSLADFSTAIKYLDSCIAVAKEIGEKSYLKVSYETLSELYAQMRKYDLAYQKHLLFSQINDTLLSDENKKQFAEMSTKYESEKKEKEIRLLKSQNEIQVLKAERSRFFNLSLVGGILVLFILTFTYFNQSKKRMKINIKLQQAYNDLASAQEKLIQQEKHALLGKLASRVAHEIQNPLNFVNNFSELAEELVDEFVKSNSVEERTKIVELLKYNLSRINHHGKRADVIIKIIQKHLRDGSGIEFFEE